MDLIAEKPRGDWNNLPGKGIVYDLTYAALSGPDTEARLRAVTDLGKSDDPRAVRPLMDLVADRDPAIRSGAITALGQLKSGRPVDMLVERLRDRGELGTIRQQAAEALAAIRSTGAIRGLREFAADPDEDPALCSRASALLDHLVAW
jgi:HEAT repeat protein